MTATHINAHYYRYRLGHLKIRCPCCGRRTFKPYIDVESGKILDGETGRCNRQHKCAYHKPPRLYLAEHPQASGSAAMCKARRTLTFTNPSYIDAGRYVLPGLRQRDKDNLCRYLSHVFGADTAGEVLSRYNVGHARWGGGSTVFWLTDAKGRYRSGKVMVYDSTTGKRVKDPHRNTVTYVHSLLRINRFNYCGCCFGENVAAANPDAKVIVVESEKTALIVMIALHILGCNDYVAVATGGVSAIRPDGARMYDSAYRLSFLKGRDIVLIPDADLADEWLAVADKLQMWCRSVTTVDVRLPPFSLTGSDDIGDYILDAVCHEGCLPRWPP